MPEAERTRQKNGEYIHNNFFYECKAFMVSLFFSHCWVIFHCNHDYNDIKNQR